jgi:hypothetical protein
VFDTQAIDVNDLTRTDQQALLRSATILHLSTRGQIDAAYAFNSRILLRKPSGVLDVLGASDASIASLRGLRRWSLK